MIERGFDIAMIAYNSAKMSSMIWWIIKVFIHEKQYTLSNIISFTSVINDYTRCLNLIYAQIYIYTSSSLSVLSTSFLYSWPKLRRPSPFRNTKGFAAANVKLSSPLLLLYTGKLRQLHTHQPCLLPKSEGKWNYLVLICNCGEWEDEDVSLTPIFHCSE